MHSEKILLKKLVRYWDLKVELFMIQGEKLEITHYDVYFLRGLLVLGVISDMTLKFLRGVSMYDLFSRNCYASTFVHNSYILVCNIASL